MLTVIASMAEMAYVQLEFRLRTDTNCLILVRCNMS